MVKYLDLEVVLRGRFRDSSV